MLIVGERINASRKTILEAIQERNAPFIKDEAKKQVESGAQILDVNAGVRVNTEKEDMVWLVKTVQETIDVPLCIDSPSHEVIEAGLAAHKGKALVNSITLETKRLNNILPLVKKYDSLVVALAMGEKEMPETVEDRINICKEIIDKVDAAGIPLENLYIDPLVHPISTNEKNALTVVESIRKIKENFHVKIIMGLSNISFGLPNRKLINRTFLTMVLAAGMDAALIDPTDKDMMAAVFAAETLLGQDQYCANYLSAFREDKL
ncbi:methyltetrahydrofolate--corrinoid methyltransferase [Candidatus Desantisbacteria bacterium CG_4_10_14_0_8_um_filter_48_22]|uniref:Methyltetrahydrofolate--corrinoid methyltransferase n=1 Tax=Candidatus Desantisbacteria bacterium CG_4_10_14_0_8_um_filter_48_22 TaxID=1974543 RepID=A0A2M7SB99_9BACT|nr:MAG: methyltetrahydrofolate--corrinoid methyltransferase [Candidatus Desantisbacteria bacterium CG1_02_49_89]PIV54198.1 MAG: methyltetrahydrofolate--corrinoid methyltransferase [Candidatus Desantisbacteria bacterium CG02_land_8_20_14_3_00_49_13]PIZ16817.1 MAG: methyltetrahydrofolate--corrinoid methyltransferase [Candidatus Desantisbacteria bacterium CG_4_10_14_0_8_um_filter_48_22]